MFGGGGSHAETIRVAVISDNGGASRTPSSLPLPQGTRRQWHFWMRTIR